MSGSAAFLSVRGLSFSYGPGKPEVLSAIDLDIAPGTTTALLGPNGSGKTTLMNLILGWLSPRAGRIEINGRPLPGHSRRELSRRIGLVPQDESVSFDLSVFDYVLLGRAPHLDLLETPDAGDRLRARRAVAAVGLTTLGQRSILTLSGGERQLAILARALTQDPQLLLLDEPMSHLDLANTRRILHVMAEVKKKGKTILFTTHDPNLAAAADAAVLLRDGRIVATGPASRTLNAKNLAAAYGVRVKVARIDHQPVILVRS